MLHEAPVRNQVDGSPHGSQVSHKYLMQQDIDVVILAGETLANVSFCEVLRVQHTS